MKPSNGRITEELLVKYLLGEASGAEQTQVQEWIGESDANRKEYYHFKTIWEESKYVASSSTVNEDAAWERFRERTREQEGRKIPLPGKYRWLKVAAVLLIVAGSGWSIYYNSIDANEANPAIAQQVSTPPVNMLLPEATPAPTAAPENAEQLADNTTTAAAPDAKSKNIPAANLKSNIPSAGNGKKFLNVAYEPTMNNRRTKEYICNATPCPLEICIIQKVKCHDGEWEPVSTCSILEPDRSGQLHYKAFDQITRNCNTDIEEIRIKRVSTGETIVLNAHSKPATAQDFFSYITGDKKGDIVAGMFHKDCNNHSDDCGLVFNNDYGSIILQ